VTQFAIANKLENPDNKLRLWVKEYEKFCARERWRWLYVSTSSQRNEMWMVSNGVMPISVLPARQPKSCKGFIWRCQSRTWIVWWEVEWRILFILINFHCDPIRMGTCSIRVVCLLYSLRWFTEKRLKGVFFDAALQTAFRILSTYKGYAVSLYNRVSILLINNQRFTSGPITPSYEVIREDPIRFTKKYANC
jgi:hypothetical protein